MCKLFLGYISPPVLYLENEHCVKSSASEDSEIQITCDDIFYQRNQSVIKGSSCDLVCLLWPTLSVIGARKSKFGKTGVGLRREMKKRQ